jgi:hypothetical protein
MELSTTARLTSARAAAGIGGSISSPSMRRSSTPPKPHLRPSESAVARLASGNASVLKAIRGPALT